MPAFALSVARHGMTLCCRRRHPAPKPAEGQSESPGAERDLEAAHACLPSFGVSDVGGRPETPTRPALPTLLARPVPLAGDVQPSKTDVLARWLSERSGRSPRVSTGTEKATESAEALATAESTVHQREPEGDPSRGGSAAGDAKSAEQPGASGERRDDFRRAADGLQLLKAASLMEEDPALASEEERRALIDVAGRIQRVLQSGRPPAEADGWKRFDLEVCTLWRCWDSATGELNLILSWEDKGSLLQWIAGTRDPDVAEPFWDGAFWDMRSQHGEGATLVSWRFKDVFTGRKKEMLLERNLCDVLDGETPCWVMSERSPVVDSLQDFSGAYGPFTIPACDPNCVRQVMAESGRIYQPAGPDRTRISMTLKIKMHSAVRWMVTDTLLAAALKMTAKSQQKSWGVIVDKWDTSGFPERIRQEDAFYGPVAKRLESYFQLLGAPTPAPSA